MTQIANYFTLLIIVYFTYPTLRLLYMEKVHSVDLANRINSLKGDAICLNRLRVPINPSFTAKLALNVRAFSYKITGADNYMHDKHTESIPLCILSNS